MIFLRLLQILLLVLAAASTADAVKVAVCEYSEVLDVNNDGLTLQHYVNNLDNTITMKLTFEGWQSWLGIGVSETGMMSDAVAVIGRISPDDGTPNVQEYNMINNNKDGSGVIPFEEGASTLVSSTFSQTEASSTLEFTKPFDEITTFIYAVGLKKNQWEGKHKLHGSLTLEEVNFCEEIDVGDEDDDGEDDGGRDDDLCELAPPIQIDSNLFLEQIRHEETFTMRLTYTGGKSWIGIGLKEEGKVSDKPPAAVIGRVGPDGKSRVDKYMFSSPSDVLFMAQQNLMDATFEQTGTTSVLTFTKYLNEEFDVPAQVVTDDSVWTYAVGLPDNSWTGLHQIYGTFEIDLTSCTDNPWVIDNPSTPDLDDDDDDDETGTGNNLEGTPDAADVLRNSDRARKLWMSHGILMFLGWAILSPLGIALALLGYRRFYLLSFAFTLFLTAVSILLAVLATKMEGKKSLETSHSKYGVAVFVMLVIQMCLSCVTKPTEKPEPEDEVPLTAPEPVLSPVKLLIKKNQDVEDEAGVDVMLTDVALNEEQSMASTGESTPPSSPTPSRSRFGNITAWDIGEAIFVIIVVSLAWYTSYTGNVSQEEFWNDVGFKSPNVAFFGCIEAILGIAVVAKAFMLILNTPSFTGYYSSMDEEDEEGNPYSPPRTKKAATPTKSINFAGDVVAKTSPKPFDEEGGQP